MIHSIHSCLKFYISFCKDLWQQFAWLQATEGHAANFAFKTLGFFSFSSWFGPTPVGYLGKRTVCMYLLQEVHIPLKIWVFKLEDAQNMYYFWSLQVFRICLIYLFTQQKILILTAVCFLSRTDKTNISWPKIEFSFKLVA